LRKEIQCHPVFSLLSCALILFEKLRYGAVWDDGRARNEGTKHYSVKYSKLNTSSVYGGKGAGKGDGDDDMTDAAYRFSFEGIMRGRGNGAWS